MKYNTSRVRLKMDNPLTGNFVVKDHRQLRAEMKIGVDGTTMTVNEAKLYTSHQREETRLLLFLAMVSYAREHYLQVVAEGSSIHHRLSEDPDYYRDIWDQNQ